VQERKFEQQLAGEESLSRLNAFEIEFTFAVGRVEESEFLVEVVEDPICLRHHGDSSGCRL